MFNFYSIFAFSLAKIKTKHIFLSLIRFKSKYPSFNCDKKKAIRICCSRCSQLNFQNGHYVETESQLKKWNISRNHLIKNEKKTISSKKSPKTLRNIMEYRRLYIYIINLNDDSLIVNLYSVINSIFPPVYITLK